MKLNTNYLCALTYTEINLKDLELEILSASGLEDEEESGVGIKGMKPLTETALKHLCSYLKIPYPFTKQIRSQGRSNVLTYIQRQLSQVNLSQVVLVGNKDVILGITDDEKLHYRGQDFLTFDAKVRAHIGSSELLTLDDVVVEDGLVNYYIFYKQESDEIEDNSNWKWGFVFSLSAHGDVKPTVCATVKRMRDVSIAHLPAKTHSYPLEYADTFDERWEQVAKFLQDPPLPQWAMLHGMIEKMNKTIASFREVKETRSKLQKLKVDADDTETLERINNTLQWKRINKEYAIKDLGYKPTKVWFSRATTPLTLFEVFNCVTKEATSAPNTLAYEVRKNLYSYAGSLLMGKPDLYMLPPVINW